MTDLWADLEAESRKPGPTMTITKAQYGALLERVRLLKKQLELHHRADRVTARTCTSCAVARDRLAVWSERPSD